MDGAGGRQTDKKRLSTSPTPEALAQLKLGDIVYLDGVVYTAREGVYQKVVDGGSGLPSGLQDLSCANFHCSPAATQKEDGSFEMGAVTATASFRFSKWIGPWFEASGCKLIIGKGGMSPKDYKKHFVPNGAIYLTTVGYGTGALLGRGVKGVHALHWREELGLAQAIWVIDVSNFGPFIVESDLEGNSLFERENAKIAANLEKVYEGTKPAVLKRFGETDDRGEELI
ncbi:MAG: fumarate hydratase C-terminal domain-containing protein [Pseudomonadota bacterium]